MRVEGEERESERESVRERKQLPKKRTVDVFDAGCYGNVMD